MDKPLQTRGGVSHHGIVEVCSLCFGSPMAEATDLKSVQCGFESHPKYQATKYLAKRRWSSVSRSMFCHTSLLPQLGLGNPVACPMIVTEQGTTYEVEANKKEVANALIEKKEYPDKISAKTVSLKYHTRWHSLWDHSSTGQSSELIIRWL